MSRQLPKGEQPDIAAANVRRLAMLFRAFVNRDDESFQRIADSIIADQLAANHHAAAKELQDALGPPTRSRTPVARLNSLKQLPRDRRSGDDLVKVIEPPRNVNLLVLSEETKSAVQRVVDEQRYRLKLARFGYEPKSRLLFWGPPGCGKTLTAHYVAKVLHLPLGLVRLSAVISSFLGDTATHLQRIFDMAAETPMVLLLDEIDAVGKNRDDPNDVGELKRVVNSLLQALDMHRSTQGLVIGASNHQYLLDSALWRRFDDVVLFPPPGPAEREVFARRFLNGIHFTGSFKELAKKTTHLSYASMEQVLQEAVKTSILEERESVTVRDISDQLRAHKERLAAARTKKHSLADES